VYVSFRSGFPLEAMEKTQPMGLSRLTGGEKFGLHPASLCPLKAGGASLRPFRRIAAVLFEYEPIVLFFPPFFFSLQEWLWLSEPFGRGFLPHRATENFYFPRICMGRCGFSYPLSPSDFFPSSVCGCMALPVYPRRIEDSRLNRRGLPFFGFTLLFSPFSPLWNRDVFSKSVSPLKDKP